MGKFDDIESAFSRLKQDNSNKNLDDLSDAISAAFNKPISTCAIIDANIPLSNFVMSISPDISTMDRVLDYAVNNTSKISTIMNIWKGAKSWVLEMNRNLFTLLTPAEMTALTCHEVWHTIYSDRTLTRLHDALSFAVGSSRPTTNKLATSHTLRDIIRIPGLVSCQIVFDKKGMTKEAQEHKKFLANEMKADAFSSESGYRSELISAIDKISKSIEKDAKGNSLNSASKLTVGILDDLSTRQQNLAKDKFGRMNKNITSGVVGAQIKEVYEEWYGEDGDDTKIANLVENARNQVFEEMGLFTKSLARIEQNQIDYAYVKANNIQSPTDQMMILSYVNGKIELCDYYLQILKDPKLSKKYRVPHSESELLRIKQALEAVREKALNAKLNYHQKNIVVYYPDGYQG
jgi:hypothetical protein